MASHTDKPEEDQSPELNEIHARLAVEAAGLGLWEWDVASDHVTINEGLAKLLGRLDLARAPFAACVLTELTHPDDREKVAAAFQSCVDFGGSRFFVEHRINRPDGDERWLWISASAVESAPNGRVEKIVGVVQDRTDQRLGEQALKAEKRRMDLALAGSLTAIWEWNPAVNLTTWSPRLAEMIGLPPDELQGEGTPLTDAIHPDDVPRIAEAVEHHVRHGGLYDVEFRMRHTAGHYIIVRSKGQAETDAAGEITRMAGSLEDITKERLAEATATQAGLRAQLAVEATELGTWELDLVAETATMDSRLSTLLGRPELADQPIPSLSMLEFTAPEDRDIVRGLFTALIKGKSEFVRNEHRVMNANGERIWIYAHVGVAERTEDGKTLKLVGVTQDLSEQKATEALLREAKERAEAASEAKSNFLATMSHEIRTPLNGMLGVAQLLGMSQLDAHQRRYVETLRSSGRTLANVIDDILDISRIEAGKLHLSPERVDICAWIAETLATFAELANAKSLSLSHEISVEAAETRYFDPKRMAQVVGNLVSNAIKFTEAGHIKVRLSAPSPNWLRVEVSDTGIGISPEDQTKVFERFSQADMTSSRTYEGSGLGLAIVSELVGLADGKLGLDSEPGKGSTFWFEIPARQTARFQSEDTPTHPPLPSSLRTLIVEDNAVNRDMLSEMLAKHGIQADCAPTGEAGLDAVAEQHFDFVLLNLHMPGLGGFETLRAIRQTGKNREIPVYVISADATPSARDEASALGANAFFTKPVDMTALVNAIADLCGTARSG